MATEREREIRWLARKYFDEYSLQFRTTWQLYLTFYVAFITLNGGALGLTVQYVTSQNARLIIGITFVFQNVLAASTAVFIAIYSSTIATEICDIARLTVVAANNSAESLPPALLKSPIPGKLGRWSGIANLAGHLLFIALWSVVAFVNFR